MTGNIREIANTPSNRAIKFAEYLRDVADMVECGDVSEFAIALYNRTSKTYQSCGHFDDRWRMIAALEYAKMGIHESD